MLERAAEIREVGAGLQVGPNGLRAFERLYVVDDIQRITFKPEAIVLMDSRSGDGVQAFRAYELARMPRTASVQLAAREMGEMVSAGSQRCISRGLGHHRCAHRAGALRPDVGPDRPHNIGQVRRIIPTIILDERTGQ